VRERARDQEPARERGRTGESESESEGEGEREGVADTFRLTKCLQLGKAHLMTCTGFFELLLLSRVENWQ
jgi:hypothetical protein